MWRHKSMALRRAPDVPGAAGIYIIARVRRLLDFPMTLDVFYVGQSTNLQRRFLEHAIPWRERNLRLRLSKVFKEPGWEFWYREFPERDLNTHERALIAALKPLGNTIHYSGGKE